MANRYLYVHVSHLHIRAMRPIRDEYLSFYWDDQFYFTPTLSLE